MRCRFVVLPNNANGHHPIFLITVARLHEFQKWSAKALFRMQKSKFVVPTHVTLKHSLSYHPLMMDRTNCSSGLRELHAVRYPQLRLTWVCKCIVLKWLWSNLDTTAQLKYTQNTLLCNGAVAIDCGDCGILSYLSKPIL